MLQFRIDLEACLRLLRDLVDGHTGRKLGQSHTALFAVDTEDAEIGDHHIDNAGAGERQIALVKECRTVRDTSGKNRW